MYTLKPLLPDCVCHTQIPVGTEPDNISSKTFLVISFPATVAITSSLLKMVNAETAMNPATIPND
jgi:hypothetical protein